MPAQSWNSHFKALLTLGVPLVGSNLAQFLIQLTDSIMLGWYSVEALAAVTLAGGIHFLALMLGAGFGIVVSPLVAAAEARGDTTEARRVTRMGMWLCVGYALLMLPGYLLTESLLLALGQDPDMAALAGQYLSLIWFALAPSLIIFVLRSYLSAVELTGIILRSTIAAALANAALNRVLIFGAFGLPELGVAGAAIASTITVIISLLWIVVYIRRELPEQNLFRRLWVADPWAAKRVFSLGLPIGLTSLAEGGLFAISSVLVGLIGTIELAAHGIALQIASLFFMAHVGLSQAATVRTGRFFGQQNQTDLRRSTIATLGLSGAIVVITVIILLAMPHQLVAVFIDPHNPARTAIDALGVKLLAVAALFQLVDAAQVMMLSMLRGVQDTRVPLILAVICYWGIGLGSAALLGFWADMGAIGIWLGLCIGLGAAAIAMTTRFWHRHLRIA